MKRARASRRSAAGIPRKVLNYLNLLTQVLMPRRVLLAGSDPQLLAALLAGCEAHPYRYRLSTFAPEADVKIPRRRLSGRGVVRVGRALPRGRQKLVVADARAVADLMPLFELPVPGGLLWCYGIDTRRGLQAELRRAARACGWRMVYQPWGEGVFCAGPPGALRLRAGIVNR